MICKVGYCFFCTKVTTWIGIKHMVLGKLQITYQCETCKRTVSVEEVNI
jgi:hypothetical protein